MKEKLVKEQVFHSKFIIKIKKGDVLESTGLFVLP